jgi:hypothetical protein
MTQLDPMIDLLPAPRHHRLVRDYYLRLGAVGMLLLSVLALSAAVLLIPTYLYLAGSASAKSTRLASLASSLSSATDIALSSRLAALSTEATTLTALVRTRSVSDTVRSVFAVPRPGVMLTSLTYAPASEKNPALITISGSALTRDALRGYQLALQGAPGIASAELPVSAYASDADIAFTITLTLAP